VDPAAAPIEDNRRGSGRRSAWRTAVSGLGQTLITAGVVILLFVGYELWWTGVTTRHDQHELLNSLHQQWVHGQPVTPVKSPPVGSALAILRIPRLGTKYQFVVVQGTSTADLIKGPGHYPGTAMPGQIGNFAVAGHRTTYLHPFYDINELKVGDPIVLETRTMWFTYRVQDIPGTTARHLEVVAPTDVSVAYPVPDQPNPNAVPTQRVLTFTSCNPRYSAAQRIVIHALLASAQPTSDGPPPALAGYHLGGS
jgi:sortase A